MAIIRGGSVVSGDLYVDGKIFNKDILSAQVMIAILIEKGFVTQEEIDDYINAVVIAEKLAKAGK